MALPPWRKREAQLKREAQAAPSAVEYLDELADEVELNSLLGALTESSSLSLLRAARSVLLDTLRRHTGPVHDEQIEALAEVLERVPIDGLVVAELIQALAE